MESGEDAALPAGLEITEDGRIQGTPEEAGVTEVEVRVTDSNGRDTTTTFGCASATARLAWRWGT